MTKRIYLKPGDRFKNLTVIELKNLSKRGSAYYSCKCDCGNIRKVLAYYLVIGKIVACRDCKRGINLLGKTFELFTVLKRAKNKSLKCRDSRWICKCQCGKIKNILGKSLLNGDSKSCGCYGYIKSRIATEKHGFCIKTHKKNETDIYSTWASMKSRHKKEVCEKWKTFFGFLSDIKDYKDKKKMGLIFMRKNINLNYDKNNYFWGTRSELMKQSINNESKRSAPKASGRSPF